MRKLSSLFICLLLVTVATAQPMKNEGCERDTRFGKATICLPFVTGMKECYTDSLVKAFADQTEMQTNTVLGYYLTQADYQNRNTPEKIVMDEYFKLYSVKQLQNYSAASGDIEKMAESVEGAFTKDNWTALVHKIDERFDSISIGVPVMVEKYSLSKNSVTYILLVKYSTERKEDLKLLVMDLLLIKERLVSLGYYRTYQGEQSLAPAKTRNDAIVAAFLKANQ